MLYFDRKAGSKPEAHIEEFHMLFPLVEVDQVGHQTYLKDSTCEKKKKGRRRKSEYYAQKEQRVTEYKHNNP